MWISTGPGGFMAYGDLWGYNLIFLLIFYKSNPWIYGDLYH